MDEQTPIEIRPQSRMDDLLRAFPGAQRALFRKYHIGGCSSCGFRPDETLEEVCRRNNGLDVDEVLAQIRQSHAEDSSVLISPRELQDQLRTGGTKILDVRSRAEFSTARIDGSVLLSHETMQEMLGHWNRDAALVIVDHQGKQALDAAAYFAGHGFTHVRCLRGGIDAWAQEIDPNVPRYQLG